MKENQRQAYLSVLGIDNYMPRWTLPGAPASAPCDWDYWEDDLQQNGAPLAGEEPASPSEPATPKNVEPTLSLSDEFVAVKPKAKAAAPDKNREKAADILKKRQVEAPVVKYSLTLWQVSPDWLVLDSRRTELALPTEQLLQNMLRAMGSSARLPRPEPLRWPLTDSLHMAGDASEAKDYLTTLLDVRLADSKQPVIWLLGESAAVNVLPDTHVYDDVVGTAVGVESMAFSSGTVVACVMPSLAEMLQKPEVKRLAWRSMQALLALVSDV